MSQTIITKDAANRTLTVAREFNAPRSLVWEYATGGDKQAKWWGPEGYPASTVRHEFTPGGHWLYYMTSPEGQKHYGRMDYFTIDAENGYTGRDSFSDESGEPNAALPMGNITAKFEDRGDKTNFVMTIVYDKVEDLETVIGMGMEEGIKSAQDNLEKLLAELQK